jgi:hypothetical protein
MYFSLGTLGVTSLNSCKQRFKLNSSCILHEIAGNGTILQEKCMQRACSKIGREGEPAIISVTQERFPKSERLPPFELQTNPVGGRGPPSKAAG